MYKETVNDVVGNGIITFTTTGMTTFNHVMTDVLAYCPCPITFKVFSRPTSNIKLILRLELCILLRKTLWLYNTLLKTAQS